MRTIWDSVLLLISKTYIKILIKKKHMVRVTSKDPACFVFLIDQSGSMEEPYGAKQGLSKSQAVSNVINRILNDMVIVSHKGHGVYKDYFDISVIGYGGEYSQQITGTADISEDNTANTENDVGSAFGGELEGKTRVPIGEIATNVLRVDERMKTDVSMDTGEIFEMPVKFPVWIEPVHKNLTPMCTAIKIANGIITDWASEHKESHPPFIINITDGAATDCQEGELDKLGDMIREVSTENGEAMIFNIHISSKEGKSIIFPSDESEFSHIDSENAKYLFRLSSPLTESMLDLANTKNYDISDDSRGFAFNADIVQLIEFLEIGTIVSKDISEQ